MSWSPPHLHAACPRLEAGRLALLVSLSGHRASWAGSVAVDESSRACAREQAGSGLSRLRQGARGAADTSQE